MHIRRAHLAIAPLVLLAACSSGEAGPGPLPDDATVSYAFHDASVPPQYHRSETLTVTKGEAHLVIDSYGDVLADRTVATPAAVWEQLGAGLDAVAALSPESLDTGCTGGTGASISVESGEQSIVDLRVDYCGDANGAMEAPIASWIGPARNLFPATEVLAPEGP
ncbi:MAG: hypothetical protein GC156_14425 [Actinomycetales bacterium]|nr:hypothetical protein [Actinomycetales bacterium]